MIIMIICLAREYLSGWGGGVVCVCRSTGDRERTCRGRLAATVTLCVLLSPAARDYCACRARQSSHGRRARCAVSVCACVRACVYSVRRRFHRRRSRSEWVSGREGNAKVSERARESPRVEETRRHVSRAADRALSVSPRRRTAAVAPATVAGLPPTATPPGTIRPRTDGDARGDPPLPRVTRALRAHQLVQG